MIVLLMIASIFLLEYGIETYFFATNSSTTNKLPMAHLENYIVSQLGGFLSLLCDLLMAAKYLDTGIKLYTQRFEKIITYSYGVFAALISVIVLLTMTIVLSKLSSQDSLLAVYCNEDSLKTARNGSIVALLVVSISGSVIFFTALTALYLIRRFIVSNRTRFGI